MSSWGLLRPIVWESQNRMCSICGRFLSLSEVVLHHVINRSQNGKDTFENAECRHATCEKACHAAFPDGNPTVEWIIAYAGGERNDRRERGRERHRQKKHRPSKMRGVHRKGHSRRPKEEVHGQD